MKNTKNPKMMVEISCKDYDDIKGNSLEKNRLIKLVEKALDKSITNLNKKQIELLSQIINSNLNYVMKMRLIGKVFDGENIIFINPEGDEWKTIYSNKLDNSISIKDK